jgi:phenylpropionate dioxygenase-like ring-hydroxylating dioxygenase large terminal subunit
MYINFWYPLCTTEELQEKPLQLEIFSLKLVAFRDAGGVAHVLSDTCAHRGGSLSKGWIEGDCVVCPYHGWQYAGSGACNNIPSQVKGKPPGRAKVDSYPVDERYGIVFAFLGDLPADERQPIYDIPQVGLEGWRASKPAVMDVNCYYERSVENGLDPYHNEFVHASQGLPIPNPATAVFEDIPWGTKFMVGYGELQEKLSDTTELRSNPDELRAGSWYYGPNTLITDIQFTATNSFIQYAFEAPISETVTRIYLVNLRNVMLEPELDEKVMQINRKVALEDVAILENLWPLRTPDTNTKELLTEGDEMVLRYRKHLKEWDAKGWRIDIKAIKQSEGDIAWAIPCPARHEAGNWVLDSVPLLPQN